MEDIGIARAGAHRDSTAGIRLMSRTSLLNRRLAQPAGADVDAEHGKHDHQQDSASRRSNRISVPRRRVPDRWPPGADKAHHRGLAHIDLEPQQSVARIAGHDPGAARQNRMQASQPRAGRTDALDWLSCRHSRRSRRTACRAPRFEWMASAITPAIGPRPKADDEDQGGTRFPGTVRANSSNPAHRKNAAMARARCFSAAKKKNSAQRRTLRRSRLPDIADQQGFSPRKPQPILAPAPEPLAHIGPDPRAVLEREDPIEIANEVAEK